MWNDEYPNFLRYENVTDFDQYLAKLKNAEYHIVETYNEIVGWAVKFDRDEGKWFVIMVNSQKQTRGIGTKLIESIKENVIELNGWVIDKDNYYKTNGDNYKSPVDFYKKIGFEITDERFENEKFTAVKVKWSAKKPAHNTMQPPAGLK